MAIGAAIALGDVLRGALVLGGDRCLRRLPGNQQQEEQIGEACSRVAGTLVGILAGSALVNLIGMHPAWTIVVILVSVSLGLYLQRADYAFLVVGVTVMVSQLYVEFGEFSNALLVARLKETAIGAAVAAATVLVVLPLHATRVARTALQGYLEVLAGCSSGQPSARPQARPWRMAIPGHWTPPTRHWCLPPRRCGPSRSAANGSPPPSLPPRHPVGRAQPGPRHPCDRQPGCGDCCPGGTRARNPASIAHLGPVRRPRIAPGHLHPLRLPV